MEEFRKTFWINCYDQRQERIILSCHRQVHLNKLTMFPSLSARDNKNLQELGDLLLELQCAKEDGVLSGLKILDEQTFLKPLIIKTLHGNGVTPTSRQKAKRREATQRNLTSSPQPRFLLSLHAQDMLRDKPSNVKMSSCRVLRQHYLSSHNEM